MNPECDLGESCGVLVGVFIRGNYRFQAILGACDSSFGLGSSFPPTPFLQVMCNIKGFGGAEYES